jgi:hypothetical protein
MSSFQTIVTDTPKHTKSSTKPILLTVRLLAAVSHEVLLRDRTVLGNVLHGSTVGSDPALLAASDVVLTVKLGETPLVGLHDLLSSGEFELGTAKSLNDVVGVGILGADRHDDLADGDTGSHLHGLTVGVTHTGGQTIGSGAGKHLVLADNVVRVSASSDVVTLLAGGLGQVLVASHTGGLKGASSQLLLLVGHKVSNEGEDIDIGLLGTAIVDSDLGVGDTSAESRLNIRLVLLETNATSRS